MEVINQGFGAHKVYLTPEWRFSFNTGNKYKDHVNIFLGPNFVFPEWRCPLNSKAQRKG